MKPATGFNERKRKKRVYNPKVCENCGKRYDPTHNIQKYCSISCSRAKVRIETEYRGIEIRRETIKGEHSFNIGALTVNSLTVAKRCIDTYLARLGSEERYILENS